MFSFFKKKDNKFVLGAPAKGRAVPLSEVSDPTFAEEMLGKGVAVIPAEGKLYAPADGEIGMVFDTLHAVSMTAADSGAEILIHVGIDTVKMNGEGFTGHVKAGDHVKKGQLILEVDLDKVKAAGYDTVTPMIVCNTPDYTSVEGISGSDVNPGDDAVVIEK
ncbi:PTS glucose transporter subunit IIA [Mediterraneibacter glycyrrhizinilyticus]|nr:PTS glucose transporter subunit IIA [Mediterraneibacter glycyrrhizinilyticus]MBM6853423.1 PTS glucose transporter subunit IIA [Mediterraneibacter glycyrrhizinilyticus]